MEQKGIKVEKVFQNERFEVRRFILDKGASLRSHTSPKDAYLHMLSGQILFYIDQEIHQLKHAESFSFPAHVNHAVESEEGAQFLIVR